METQAESRCRGNPRANGGPLASPARAESPGVEALLAFPPFTRLGPEARALLATGQVSRHLASREALLHKGQVISGAYFVLAGRLRVYALAPNGTEATLYQIEPGETCVFALNSLFNDLLYPAWVEAVADTTLACIPGPVYRRLFHGEAGVRDFTLATLSTLVFRLMGELESVHACTLRERLASLLLLRGNSAGEVAMTQQQLADHLGTTREVVARLLGEFSAQGLISTGRGRVRLVQPAILASWRA